MIDCYPLFYRLIRMPPIIYKWKIIDFSVVRLFLIELLLKYKKVDIKSTLLALIKSLEVKKIETRSIAIMRKSTIAI